MDDFRKKYLERLDEEEKEAFSKNDDAVNAFKEVLLAKNIDMGDSAFKYFQTIGIVAEDPNLLMKLELGLTRNKDGLFEFDSLTKMFDNEIFNEGYIFAKTFVLMATHFFRRGFSKANNFAPRFVELFWKLNDPKITKSIALDLDRVRINTGSYRFLELDTWYGAKFNQDIAAINDGVSKLRPPMDFDSFDISFFFAGAYALDVKWSTKNGIKTLQMEEFKTDEMKVTKDGQVYFPVRYVHAEFVENSNFFRHFDGAIHFYSSAEYYSRRDSDFNYNSKSGSQVKGISQKLFRMDGEISIEIWLQFTSHFFSGNPLIIEYFEGEYPVHIRDLLAKMRAL